MVCKILKQGMLLLLFSFVGGQLSAEEKPLWELGAGLAVLSNPHYLGADQNQTYVLPIPYINYHGEKLRADRSGVRGFLYNSQGIKIGVSGGGALPVNSDDSDAREGMEDLDAQFELGPVIEVKLYKDEKHLLRFDLPVRGAFILGDEFLRHRGWTSNPRFYYQTDIGHWQIGVDAGVVWSDQRYHAYIYDVDSEDVTVDRPFYQSESGFTASRYNVDIRRRFKNCFFAECYVGAKFRYYNLSGADNVDSPLVKDEDYLAASFVIAWIFGKSSKTVNVD